MGSQPDPRMTPHGKLRVLQVVVQPLLVWDDGSELVPGPEVQPLTVPLSKLAEIAHTIPEQVATLEAQLNA